MFSFDLVTFSFFGFQCFSHSSIILELLSFQAHHNIEVGGLASLPAPEIDVGFHLVDEFQTTKKQVYSVKTKT